MFNFNFFSVEIKSSKTFKLSKNFNNLNVKQQVKNYFVLIFKK